MGSQKNSLGQEWVRDGCCRGCRHNDGTKEGDGCPKGNNPCGPTYSARKDCTYECDCAGSEPVEELELDDIGTAGEEDEPDVNCCYDCKHLQLGERTKDNTCPVSHIVCKGKEGSCEHGCSDCRWFEPIDEVVSDTPAPQEVVKNQMEVGEMATAKIDNILMMATSILADAEAKAKEKSPIETLMGAVATTLAEQHRTASNIKKEGNQLIIPSFMTPKEAASSILQWEKEEETPTQHIIEIEGHPDDTMHAFYNAMQKTFGVLSGDTKTVQTFFGDMTIPGRSVTIMVGFNKAISVPYGAINIPGLPLKMECMIAAEDRAGKLLPKPKHKFLLKMEFAKKYQGLADMIEKNIREELREHPIFKGQAINSRFEFIDLKGFPLEKIVYTQEERLQLEANIFRPIRSTSAMQEMRFPLKRTVLLYGKYGTGKTLTALLAANVCVDNGWTFINVVPGDDIAVALEVAKKYQPALVFFEDIDAVTKGERDEGINTILNTIDGILSKSVQIMTVLTTNNVGNIAKGMMRPGRIDFSFEMGRLTPEAIRSMVEVYTRGKLEGELDMSALGEAATNYTPAFIVEACQRAVLYALERVQGNTGALAVTSGDVVAALKGLRSQFDLMMEETVKRAPTIEAAIEGCIHKVIKGNGPDTEFATVEQVQQLISDYHD